MQTSAGKIPSLPEVQEENVQMEKDGQKEKDGLLELLRPRRRCRRHPRLLRLSVGTPARGRRRRSGLGDELLCALDGISHGLGKV